MNPAVGSQMRGWDAATWRTASGDANMRSTVIALAILDRPPDWPRLRARLDRLTHFVPELRMRPYVGAFGISAPRLAFDPDFDIDVHAHRYRLAEGAGWDDLLAEARRMSLTDFDSSRPLWEATVIEGLPGGQAAFLMKLHHAIADGQATVMIGLALFELGEQPNPDEPPAPDLPPVERIRVRDISVANAIDNVRRGMDVASGAVRTVGELLRGTVVDTTRTWSQAIETMTSIGRFTAVPDGPLSPIMTGRGTTYRFAAFDLSFADLRRAAKIHDASINDAFMAAVAIGLDMYHRRNGAVVEELRMNVPISLRGDPGDRSAQASNAVTIARFPMPIAGLTVAERMSAAHGLVEHWRAEPALRLADPLAEISWFVPVPMLAHAAQASDVTTSNVPGPPIPLYLAGARMIAAYPLVATIGAAVNITMVTYDGKAFIGLSADEQAVDDVIGLTHDVRAGFTEVTGVEPGPVDRFAAPNPS